VVDAAVAGSPPDLRLDIWPALGSSPADNSSVVIEGAKGAFRLKDNRRSWSIGEAKIYGLSFSCIEVRS
jgi:hypothetical protein